MTALHLPFPPSVNSIWKHGKNRKTGKPLVYLDPKYRAWKKEADNSYVEQKRLCTKLTGRCFIALVFDETRRRSNTDLDNRIKVVLDAVQRFGLIENDSMISKLDASWGPSSGVSVKLFPA